jgi:hypothetical protein
MVGESIVKTFKACRKEEPEEGFDIAILPPRETGLPFVVFILQDIGVLFHRGVCRAFLILPVQKHYAALMERTNTLVQKWGKDEWKPGKPRGHFTGPIF